MSTIPYRAELLAVIGSPCPYCGQTMQIPDRPPSRDHIMPRSKGYSLDGNRALVCFPCNRDKSSDPWRNGIRACHELATLAPIMWPHSLNVGQANLGGRIPAGAFLLGPVTISLAPTARFCRYGQVSHSLRLSHSLHRLVRPRMDHPLCGTAEYLLRLNVMTLLEQTDRALTL